MYGNNKKLIAFLSEQDNKVIFELKETGNTRSKSQNNLYFKYLSDLAICLREVGVFTNTDDLHAGLSGFLLKGSYRTCSVTGKRLTYRQSTTKLNKKEFSQYIKDIEKFIRSQYEVTCPLATDYFYNK